MAEVKTLAINKTTSLIKIAIGRKELNVRVQKVSCIIG